MPEITFGSFLAKKRLEREMTLRGFAIELGISPVYMCNIEKDRRAAPTEELLEKIAVLLLLNKTEKAQMLDLAAKSKRSPAVALDLPKYINEKEIVRVALRTAMEVDAADGEWIDFIERLQKKHN